MKIERVNDRQIRCTLTGNDLESRQLKISELAYGSEKARMLFSDMMRQAKYEFGFEAGDIPLVIEAIPVNSDCIILIITKVEDPEELDTRFSKFAPLVSSNDETSSNVSLNPSDFAEEMINMLKEVKNSISKRQDQPSGESAPDPSPDQNVSHKPQVACLLCGNNLNSLVSFAKCVAGFYNEKTSLYRNHDREYLLLMDPGNLETLEFARVCNIASEFGRVEPATAARISYLNEHYDTVIANDAIGGLLQI